MKGKILAIALLAVIVGFGACKSKKPGEKLSNACLITSFSSGGVQWEINDQAGTIKHTFDKGTSLININPTIQTSLGASYVSTPSGPSYDFSDDKTVSFTVTAEDGKTTKKYTASATATN